MSDSHVSRTSERTPDGIVVTVEIEVPDHLRPEVWGTVDRLASDARAAAITAVTRIARHSRPDA